MIRRPVPRHQLSSPRWSRPCWLIVAAVVAVVLFAAWIAVCVRYVAQPRIDAQEQVDAVYVLGPLENHIDAALAVMSEGVAPVMVATTSINQETGQPYFTQYCGTTTSTYRIECVVPDPYTTRGEARMLGDLARQRGWTRVALLASTPQAERARLLMERCVGATVLVWDDPTDRTIIGWLGEFVHQSGGWVQAQLEPTC